MRGGLHLILGFGTLAVSGCAGDGATETPEQTAPVMVADEPRSEAWATLSADELEPELFSTRAGKALIRSLRAHGGWDRWRQVCRLRFQVKRLEQSSPEPAQPDSKEPPAGVGTVPASFGVSSEYVFDVDAASGKLVRVPAEERISDLPETSLTPLLAAPFIFVDETLRAVHLGVELDSSTGESFEKVKYIVPGGPSAFVCIAYFDRTSGELKRLLVPKAGGGFWLAHLSGRQQGEGGVELPTRRVIHSLAGLYSHVASDQPFQVEVVDLQVEFATGPQ